MKNKEITYNRFKDLTKNKDFAVNHILNNTLCKTQSMFIWFNLPPSIPQTDLERILQTNGTAFFTEVNGTLYALQGTRGGEIDVYGNPTMYTVANVALNLSKEYDIERDGVLIKNDLWGNGLVDVIGKYAAVLVDSQISLNTAAVLSRLTCLISASDEKTKESAEMYVEKLLKGDFSIIGENAFLNGVRLQSLATGNYQIINQLIELVQYYKSNMLAEIGLNSNYNMKRERLSENEILLNNDDLLPFVENMLQCRKTAAIAINEKYGTEIAVELKSVWKTTKETNDKAAETENTTTDEEQNTVSRETENTINENTPIEEIVNVIRELREENNEEEPEKIEEKNENN